MELKWKKSENVMVWLVLVAGAYAIVMGNSQLGIMLFLFAIILSNSLNLNKIVIELDDINKVLGREYTEKVKKQLKKEDSNGK